MKLEAHLPSSCLTLAQSLVQSFSVVQSAWGRSWVLLLLEILGRVWRLPNNTAPEGRSVTDLRVHSFVHSLLPASDFLSSSCGASFGWLECHRRSPFLITCDSGHNWSCCVLLTCCVLGHCAGWCSVSAFSWNHTGGEAVIALFLFQEIEAQRRHFEVTEVMRAEKFRPSFYCWFVVTAFQTLLFILCSTYPSNTAARWGTCFHLLREVRSVPLPPLQVPPHWGFQRLQPHACEPARPLASAFPVLLGQVCLPQGLELAPGASTLETSWHWPFLTSGFLTPVFHLFLHTYGSPLNFKCLNIFNLPSLLSATWPHRVPCLAWTSEPHTLALWALIPSPGASWQPAPVLWALSHFIDCQHRSAGQEQSRAGQCPWTPCIYPLQIYAFLCLWSSLVHDSALTFFLSTNNFRHSGKLKKIRKHSSSSLRNSPILISLPSSLICMSLNAIILHTSVHLPLMFPQCGMPFPALLAWLQLILRHLPQGLHPNPCLRLVIPLYIHKMSRWS